MTDDGSLTLDNASVQRLMDYGLLHYTDNGWYVGRWPKTNTPTLSAAPQVGEVTEAMLEAATTVPAWRGDEWIHADYLPEIYLAMRHAALQGE